MRVEIEILKNICTLPFPVLTDAFLKKLRNWRQNFLVSSKLAEKRQVSVGKGGVWIISSISMSNRCNNCRAYSSNSLLLVIKVPFLTKYSKKMVWSEKSFGNYDLKLWTFRPWITCLHVWRTIHVLGKLVLSNWRQLKTFSANWRRTKFWCMFLNPNNFFQFEF